MPFFIRTSGFTSAKKVGPVEFGAIGPVNMNDLTFWCFENWLMMWSSTTRINSRSASSWPHVIDDCLLGNVIIRIWNVRMVIISRWSRFHMMSLRSIFDDGLVLIDTRHVIGDQVMGWGQGLTRCHRDTRHLSLNYYPVPYFLPIPGWWGHLECWISSFVSYSVTSPLLFLSYTDSLARLELISNLIQMI